MTRRTMIDIHILQTVPPSNLNRDDTGSPKTAVYGGVRRARVSSQAWKRATRAEFEHLLDRTDLGVRTKRLGEALAERIRAAAPDLAGQATELADTAMTATKIKMKAPAKPKKGEPAPEGGVESEYLVFLSHQQLDAIAEATVAAHRRGEVPDAATLKNLANQRHSIDIALFGRMLADLADINVDAAVQVAHAISVHAVDNEFDYYTAVDDRKNDAGEQGAGMIGTVEFNSATLYRYATLNVNQLHETLGDAQATCRAVSAFLAAFVRSMPTGKQNTFANRTLPDAVLVRLRDTQPINLVGAFEDACVTTSTSGRLAQAAERLATHTKAVEDAYQETPVAAWTCLVGEHTQPLAALGTPMRIGELIAAVTEQVGDRLGATG